MMSISPLEGQWGPTIQLHMLQLSLRRDFGGHLQRRPGATDSTWHVSEIKNYQRTGVDLVAFEANTVPATTGSLVGVVNANINLSVADADKTASLGGALIHEVDIARCGISSLFNQVSELCKPVLHAESTNCVEAKHGKELVSAVVILKGIASYTEVDEARTGKERGEMHDGKDGVQRSGSHRYMRQRKSMQKGRER